MRRRPARTLLGVGIAISVLILLALIAYTHPGVNSRLAWRIDVARTYLRGVFNPAGKLPTALPEPAFAVTLQPSATPAQVASPTVSPSPTKGPTPTRTPTPTPLPQSISLTPPAWEKQGPNNCGPASLSMYLSYYSWEGNQEDIASLLKPLSADRNVNVEELIYYVRTRAGWLNAEFRVGGDIQLLKSFLAAGLPVMIEEGFIMAESYWPNDDRWAGHYLLLTAYNDATQTFTGQDSFRGPDLEFTYEALDKNWQAFNRVYIILYPADQAGTVETLLRENWDPNANRQHALELAQAETEAEPDNAYTWFNLGSNLVYFERYGEAARAYDTARNLGLPQRMLRYQFGPFFAYFFSGRNADLLALTEYALEVTPNSEETLLWKGWGLYREGKQFEAIESFQAALVENPNYQDAQYALDFVIQNPP